MSHLHLAIDDCIIWMGVAEEQHIIDEVAEIGNISVDGEVDDASEIQ
jgi:hypothetical protein